MCGIVGIMRFDGHPVEAAALLRLNDQQIHRGPDDQGWLVEAGVGLAVRRLSILDLARSHQPMTSPDGRLVMVFNGECYNFRALRQELQDLGHFFRTDGDTEVVLTGYRQWGGGILDRMIGMWALAIYDREYHQLFLARDRLGKKQLYYGLTAQELVFGSEMATLLRHGGGFRRLRREALPEYLTYGYVGGPLTAVEGVQLLPEGHWAVVTASGGMTITRYWDLQRPPPDPPPKDEAAAAEACWALLVDAVRQRLTADVPVAVMLSSGLDSSAIGHILARELRVPLQTFSLGYAEAGFDESVDAGRFAATQGLPWHSRRLAAQEVALDFDDLIDHGSSLQGNTAQIIYYYVNRMIREAGYKVALNGSGGDELFAGYRTYQADRLFAWWRRLPGPVQRGVRAGVLRLPASFGRVSLDYMLKQFTQVPWQSPWQAHGYWRSVFNARELADVLVEGAGLRELSLYERIFMAQGGMAGVPTINRLLAADLAGWLIPMLPWVDNQSMAHSVELRLPFLDHRLVAQAIHLPAPYLFRGWALKRLMRRFLANRLPGSVLRRSKRGTHLPLGKWMNGPLAPLVDHHLSPEVVRGHGVLRWEPVARWRQEHREGRGDHTFKLWHLVVLHAWMSHFGIGG